MNRTAQDIADNARRFYELYETGMLMDELGMARQYQNTASRHYAEAIERRRYAVYNGKPPLSEVLPR